MGDESFEPFFAAGELLWRTDTKEVVHVVGRWESVRRGVFRYDVADPTHTTKEQFSERDLRDITIQLDIAVLFNRKPVTRLDIDALVKRISEAEGPPHIDYEGFQDDSQSEGDSAE